MKKTVLALAALAALSAAADLTSTRIFRAPRYVRGNTNLLVLQPIDEAEEAGFHERRE